jgi:hypothetical protein
MSFDPGWIMVELVVSGVGFVLFTYGRKQQRIPQAAAGVLFMVYPFFVSSVTGLIVGAGLLVAGLWLALRLGW